MKSLLFLSNYSYVHKNAVAATLAWITKARDWGFEVYYDAPRSGEAYGGPPAEIRDYFGSTIIGGHHVERFMLLRSLFDLKYAIAGGHKSFLPFIKLMDDKRIIVETDSISELYREIFSHFELKFPDTAVMIKADSVPLGAPELGSYCYPEIYYRNAIGIASAIEEIELLKLKEQGIKKLYLVYASSQKVEQLETLGFAVEIVDELLPNDTYGTALTRLAQRWMEKSKRFFLGDPILVSYWLPWCCHNDAIAVSETSVITNLKEEGAKLDDETNVLFGRQTAEEDILEISRKNYCFQIVDPGRPLFPTISQKKGKFYEPKQSYFDREPTDHELQLFADEGKILSSILFWCPDLRHVECLYRLFDLVSITNAKIGIGITAHYYQFNFHPLQLINIPLECGGVYPNVEPLLCSCGLGVASEAEGFMTYETLLSNLRTARRIVSEVTGEKFLPKGCFPFLDIKTSNHLDILLRRPFVRRVARPNNYVNERFMEALTKSGFEYVVSLSSLGKPEVTFRKENFLAINYTAGQWTGVSPYVVIDSAENLKSAEKVIARSGKPGWILSAIDSPLWLYSKPVWRSGHKLWEIINYMKTIGVSKKLVNVTPHTIARYAKTLQDKGLL